MTHYLDAAIDAARAAGELLRQNFHQPLRVNSSEAHDIKLEIDVQHAGTDHEAAARRNFRSTRSTAKKESSAIKRPSINGSSIRSTGR
ncbi:MAG: hypothetical protein WKF47_06615 [Geodermatophilaceae bacterium]